ncbi:alanine dehydrogenase [Vicingus serpentipes]|uniref:Saccharopine dehydrogenase [NAD(+), L-lysine-forming] n=1 Tax=Vicingus serpentipes TaxID=1926625 RepID=A0A5C6RS85_9FLAO|nr:NAD(P)-dependent oxidoreductase [Vicingus serpentipes]TXB65306.1 alanine dehydrogenase [Vicingus serpentipes]
MKIGVLKEGKIPPDERVPLSPIQCKEIIDKYPNVNLVVQKSDVRRITEQEYIEQGIELVDNVDDCDIILGVKEVPKKDLIPNKTYFYFSHTIKKQSYNRDLLLEMLNKNITMVDYETLTNAKGNRLIGFGKYAGIVGCYNSFYAYGKRTGKFDLKRAYQCVDRAEMEAEIPKINLPNDYKIVITGGGRVATGIIEILNKINIKKVSAQEILNNTYSEPVYAQLLVDDYYKMKDDSSFKRSDVYKTPEKFERDFMKFAKIADMYISGHFWDNKAPYIFNREDAKNSEFKIKVVGDVSCDIDTAVACTIRPSTIANPLYGYDANNEKETNFDNENAITVMAVDNLPCELPRDASADFGREFIDKILPHLIDDKEQLIERATICKNGNLMPKYEYLRDYVNGEITA